MKLNTIAKSLISSGALAAAMSGAAMASPCGAANPCAARSAKTAAANRWGTAEAWYPAEQVIRMLDRFVIDHAFPSLPVNRWISAMFVLYRPHIEALLKKRDEIVGHGLQRIPARMCSRTENWTSPVRWKYRSRTLCGWWSWHSPGGYADHDGFSADAVAVRLNCQLLLPAKLP